MRGRIGWVAGALAAGLLIGLAASAFAQGDDEQGGKPKTITVTSTATAKAAPDVAVVDIGVRSEDAESVAALEANAETMQEVLDAVKGAGVAEDDVQTLNVGLDRRVVNRGEPDEHEVFVASNTVEVKVRDLGATGMVIDAAVRAGADSVHDIRFELSDPSEVRTQALEQAIRGARLKADALALAAGTQVTGVLTITEEGFRPPVYEGYRAVAFATAEAAVTTPIVPPTDLEARVTVTVVWAIA